MSRRQLNIALTLRLAQIEHLIQCDQSDSLELLLLPPLAEESLDSDEDGALRFKGFSLVAAFLTLVFLRDKCGW